MYTATVILHVFVCFLMIAAILLQAGKGAEIGAAFGGSSQTVFGSRGPGTFLSKVTVGTAIIFMLTSLGLAVLSKQGSVASSVIDIPAKSEEAPSTAPTTTAPTNETSSPPSSETRTPEETKTP